MFWHRCQDKERKFIMNNVKKDCNKIEIKGKIYTIVDRVRETSDVREIPYTIKNYVEKVESEKINRDNNMNRTSDQWTKKQSSRFIEAILHNHPTGEIAVAKRMDNHCCRTYILDGLQRTTTLTSFLHDKFSLDKRAKAIWCKCTDSEGNTIEETIEIAGKKFSELPDVLREFFEEYKLKVYIYENFDDEELDEMIMSANNGKQPNAFQRLRFLLGSDNMKELQPICDSDLWADTKGCKAKNDGILATVIRTLMLMTCYECKSFGASSMNKFVIDFDKYVTLKTINRLYDLVEQFEEIKDDLKEEEREKLNSITIPNYIVNLDRFNSQDKSNLKYVDFLRRFWQNEEYINFENTCDAKITGVSVFAYDSVLDRQYAVDDCLDEYNTKNVSDNENSNAKAELDNDIVSCDNNDTTYSEFTDITNKLDSGYVQTVLPIYKESNIDQINNCL